MEIRTHTYAQANTHACSLNTNHACGTLNKFESCRKSSLSQQDRNASFIFVSRMQSPKNVLQTFSKVRTGNDNFMEEIAIIGKACRLENIARPNVNSRGKNIVANIRRLWSSKGCVTVTFEGSNDTDQEIWINGCATVTFEGIARRSLNRQTRNSTISYLHEKVAVVQVICNRPLLPAWQLIQCIVSHREPNCYPSLLLSV